MLISATSGQFMIVYRNSILLQTKKSESDHQHYGQAPSYSLYIEPGKSTGNDVTRINEFHCFVSLPGPFYTIISQDKMMLIGEG